MASIAARLARALEECNISNAAWLPRRGVLPDWRLVAIVACPALVAVPAVVRALAIARVLTVPSAVTALALTAVRAAIAG
ncbi:MAG: hypothetical protein WA767_01970, partial [Pseudolabrys sp.]